MRLLAEVILEKLQERYDTVQYGNLSVCSTLGRPFLYHRNMTVQSGHFYLLEDCEIMKTDILDENICIIVRNPSSNFRLLGNVPYIYIGTKDSLSSILNFVQEIYDSFENWKDKLDELRLSDGSIQDILFVSYFILGNPIVVHNMDFVIEASIGYDSLPEKCKIFLPDAYDPYILETLKKDQEYNLMRESTEIFSFSPQIVGINTITVNLWRNSICAYRLTIIEQKKKISAGDSFLLKFLSPYVQHCIYLKERVFSTEINVLRPIFERVLSDKTADYIEISQQLSQNDWSPKASYLCMVLKTTYLDEKNLTVNMICSYLEKSYPGTCSFPYKEDVVTYFNLDLLGFDKNELQEKIKYFIRESFLKAGYSWVMEGHSNLRRQYVQAELALDVGSRIHPYMWIHCFEDVAFSYILEQSTRRLPGYMLCHEKLRKLEESDLNHGTEYIKTLRIYLDEHLSATRASAKLFIHRSTFLYRLDKIKEILESTLDDPDEILYLSFSLRLLKNEQSKISIF